MWNFHPVFGKQGQIPQQVKCACAAARKVQLLHDSHTLVCAFVVVQGKLHITALRFGCIGGIAASVLATIAVCLAIAVVFDNTVVIVCSVIFDKLTKRLTGGAIGARRICDEMLVGGYDSTM